MQSLHPGRATRLHLVLILTCQTRVSHRFEIPGSSLSKFFHHFKINRMKRIILFVIALVSVSWSALSQVSLTATVGSLSGSYTTLKEAFDKINDGTHQGAVTIAITANTTESSSAILNASGSGSASYTSVSIQSSGGGSRTVSGNLAGSLINLNGADYVTIDGLNSGGNSLTFDNSNTSTSASTIFLTNGATHNILTNCTVLGSATANYANAVITFNSGTNTYNTISYCNVGPSGSNKPWACIISGSGGTANNYNTVDHCNLYDFVGGTGTLVTDRHSGVYLYFGSSTGWTITNNSFYQTSTVNKSDGIVGVIHIRSGDGYTVTGNYIGGSAANCGGSAMTYTGSMQCFYGIEFQNNVGTTNLNVINGNIIRNISFTTSNTTASSNSSSARFSLINLYSGKFNVTNNTIGRTDQNGSITYTQTGTTYSMISLINGSYNPGTITINDLINNSISGVTIDARYYDCFGIQIDAGASNYVNNMSNNLVGSLSQASSISLSVPTSSVTRSYFCGIVVANTAVSGNSHVNGNIIQNIARGSGGNSDLYGIYASTDCDLTNNFVQNITSANTGGIYGLSHSYATSGTLVGNTVKNLSGSGFLVYGLYNSSAVTAIKQNYIAALKSTTNATITGILTTSSSTNGDIVNNLISLGYGADGSSLPNYNFYGINVDNTGPVNVYFNTVYIGGTGTSGASSSYAFNKVLNSGTSNIKDNIFSNFRSNSGGSGSHYAIKLAGVTSMTINYNDYYVSGTGGVLGNFASSDKATIAAWRTATSQDVNSVNTNPNFTTPSGVLASLNYQLGETSLCIGAGTAAGSTTVDITGGARPIPSATNPDLGAYESPLSAATTSYTWTGSVSNNWGTAGNWSPSVVPDGNAIVTIGSGSNPVVNEDFTTPATCYNLTLASGATLTIAAGKALTVSGSLTNNAGAGALLLESNDTDGTGSLIENNNGVDATVQQFLYGSNVGDSFWHMMSSPIVSAQSGLFTGEYLTYYDETAHQFSYIIPTDVTLTPVKGYGVWTNADMTQNFAGTLNNGIQNIILSRTWNSSGWTNPVHAADWDGWNLVGNPYPCPVDVTLATRTNVENSTYFWNFTSGNYKIWVPGGGETHSKYAPGMQGFFVHCTGSGTTGQAPPESGAVTFTNIAKTHNLSDPFYKSSETMADLLRISVDGNVNSYSDELSVYFDPERTSGYESGFDALKFYGDHNAPQIFTLAGEKEVTVNACSFTEKNITLPMGFFCGVSGNYTIHASNLNSFSNSITVGLEDLKTGTTRDLKQNPDYTFAYETGDIQNRFLLHFYNPSLGIQPNTNGESCRIYSYGNSVYIANPAGSKGMMQVELIDLVGRTVYSSQLSAETIQKITPALNAGYYIVKVLSNSGTTTGKVFLK
jgi:hypothetical protein